MSARICRAVLYLRRSDKKQDASIEDQRKECTVYANAQDFQLVGEYVDDGISGDEIEKRPAFMQMREDISNGAFDVVVCWRDDRFARADSIDDGYLIRPFREAGVRLYTVMQGYIDWGSYEGRLMSAIRAEAKHAFLRDLSENVVRGQKSCAMTGSWIGSRPYGYIIVGPEKNKRLEFDSEAKVQTVQRIFDEYVNQERNQSSIARKLNADGVPGPRGNQWGLDAISTILRNRAYIGTYQFNKYSRAKFSHLRNGEVTKGRRKGKNPESDIITIEDNHEPIIADKALFHAAQTILARHRRAPRPELGADAPGMLAGVLLCGRCGGKLHLEDRRRGAYDCSNRKGDKRECEGLRVRERDVLNEIAEYVEEEFFPARQSCRINGKLRRGEPIDDEVPPPEYLKLYKMVAGQQMSPTDAKLLTKRIKKLTNEIANARANVVLLDPANIAAGQATIAKMDEQLAILRAQLNERPSELSIIQIVDTIWHCWGGLMNGSAEQLRQVVRHLESITVHTTIAGHGTRIRHTLVRSEVRFRPVGRGAGKVNPHRPG